MRRSFLFPGNAFPVPYAANGLPRLFRARRGGRFPENGRPPGMHAGNGGFGRREGLFPVIFKFFLDTAENNRMLLSTSGGLSASGNNRKVWKKMIENGHNRVPAARSAAPGATAQNLGLLLGLLLLTGIPVPEATFV